MALETFHPLIQQWFLGRFRAPTEPQREGWPPIAAGAHTLIAAPTGSGKTLTAFLAAIDRLLKESIAGTLPDEIRVIYVSPLRALSNDMHRNLEVPLAEITALALAEYPHIAPIRAGLRTGDTPAHKRASLLRKPPHILVTTPESLYLLLTSVRGRERLLTVETVIVDEIHALVRDKRGSHLALTLERLAALCPKPLQRIGLSATQRPIDEMAKFLVGCSRKSPLPLSPSPPLPLCVDNPLSPSPNESIVVAETPCAIIDVGHQRDLDLAIEVPKSELGAVCMHEQWAEINARLCELIGAHRSTLIFVNTRRMAERVTHHLTQLLGEEAVSSHHGSLAADLRQNTEQRLKSGRLKAVVATASLELGLDIGFIDLVVQLGSPRSIATFLQRVGRSGHALGLVPKGRLFALTRDELLEAMALIRAIHGGRLDAIVMPVAPLDVLAQQIVAEVACREWGTDELFALCRQAWPYRNLDRFEFDRVIGFLSEGITNSSGRGRVYLHHDQVGRRVRARPGARIVAASNGGAIPEIASYRVVAEPEHTVVGTLDEDFASESQAGEIFLLGNTSWRILHVRGNDVAVADAHGAPPSIPFWRGEAPGRTLELSEEVSMLREQLERRVENPAEAESWLTAECCVAPEIAHQAVEYVAAEKAAIGLVPSQRRIVYERFFDESGGMQMVVHAPFGSRITKAWGLAMRKRFCRSFDFELQATADDDGFVLSLGPQHSFPLESMFGMLNAGNARQLLEQALLYVPTFQTRWRWNVTRALLVQRFKDGKKVPPALQRFRADDLLTAVFPKLTGCQENVTGDLELPDHPLARQSMDDSLREAHDVDGLIRVLERIERGEIELVARDTREPSPFCYELLNADPYAFLDGGEIAERRTRAVATRRSLTVESVSDLGRLDPEAIARVIEEAQPLVRTPDELHDLLLSRIVVPAGDGEGEKGGQGEGETADEKHFSLSPPLPLSLSDAERLFAALSADRRATTIRRSDRPPFWAAAERLPAVFAAFPDAAADPPLDVPPEVPRDWTPESARVAMARGLIETAGPVTASAVAEQLGIALNQAEAALEALEGEGVVLRGQFSPSRRPGVVNGQAGDANGQAGGVNGRAGGVNPRIEPPCDIAFEQEPQTPATGPVRDDSQRQGGRADSGDPGVNTPGSPGSVVDASGSPGAVVDGSGSPENLAGAQGEIEIEWCHRRLLARIHRLTMEGLRKQIEPVTVDVFIRFLTRHHGLVPGSKRSGPSGVFEVLSMLQGLDLPAIVWERDLLPARIEKYRPEQLDELCLTGEVGWGRLYPARRMPDRSRPMASLTRVVPISLYLRSDLEWLEAQSLAADPATLSSPAQELYRLLATHGAQFASDLLAATRMLPAQLNDVLGELVSQGLVTADGFAGLRALVSARGSQQEPARGRPRLVRRRAPLAGSGRWSLWRRAGESSPPLPLCASPPLSTDSPADPSSPQTRPASEVAEHWAWQLLRRWGVVFRDLLEREPGAPRWFELLTVLRRLEARGEIRGGRFITGVAGEQFALGDTVRLLRQLRDEKLKNGTPSETRTETAPEGPNREPAGSPVQRELVVIAAADPLNLVGILTPHDRVTSNASNRVAYLDGVPVAALVAGEVTYIGEPSAELRRLLHDGRVLLRHRHDFEEPEGEEPNGRHRAADAVESPEPRERRTQKALFPRTIPRPFIR